MNIGVIGAGHIGSTLAKRLAGLDTAFDSPTRTGPRRSLQWRRRRERWPSRSMMR
jgi:predicted dinucleotide-binding enzyme